MNATIYTLGGEILADGLHHSATASDQALLAARQFAEERGAPVVVEDHKLGATATVHADGSVGPAPEGWGDESGDDYESVTDDVGTPAMFNRPMRVEPTGRWK